MENRAVGLVEACAKATSLTEACVIVTSSGEENYVLPNATPSLQGNVAHATHAHYSIRVGI